MKHASKLFLAFVVMLSLLLAACGGGGSSSHTSSQSSTPQATLTTLTVSPATPSVPLGKTQQMSATGIYSDSTTKALTSTANWKTSDPAVATINNAGLLTTLKKGAVTVTATSGTVSNSTTVTVTDPVLTQIDVIPGTAQIAKGQSQQFVAYGIRSDNSQQDISALVTWASSAKAIADVTATGLCSGKAQGSTSITATLDSVTGTADLSVTAAVLQQIDLTPDIASIPIGGDLQLVATGTFSDNTTQDLIGTQWTSADDSIATVDNNGLVKSVSAGTVVITGKIGSISDTTTVTVTPATLVDIAVTSSATSLAKGTTQQFTATGTFTDGSTEDISTAVTWTSDKPEVATVDAEGFVKAVAEGTAIIAANSGGKTGTLTLVVTSAAIASISITPGNPGTGIGGTQQFTATGVFTDASTQDLTSQVTWMSSSATVATINSAGLAVAVGTGTATISAAYGNVTGSTSFTVSVATLTSITVSPDSPFMAPHTKMTLTATGHFSDGSSRVLAGASWNSSRPKFASVNGSGVVRSKRAGTAVIKATVGKKSGSTTLTVTDSQITSVVVSPATATIAAGSTKQFTATGYFSDLSLPSQDLTASVYWKTSDYATATVSSTGLATGLKSGTANITAAYGGKVSAPAVLTVN